MLSVFIVLVLAVGILVQYLLSNQFYFPPMTNFSADYLQGSLSFWSLGTEWIYTVKCSAVLCDNTIIPIIVILK